MMLHAKLFLDLQATPLSLSTEEPVTVEYAAAILSHMAREYSTKTKLLSLSAHQLLLPLMTGEDPNTKRYCLETVCQLVELHQARRAVAEEEGEQRRELENNNLSLSRLSLHLCRHEFSPVSSLF